VVDARKQIKILFRTAVRPCGDVEAFESWRQRWDALGGLSSETGPHLRVNGYLYYATNRALQKHALSIAGATLDEDTLFLAFLSGNVEVLEQLTRHQPEEEVLTYFKVVLRRPDWWAKWGSGRWGNIAVVRAIGSAALRLPKKKLKKVRDFVDVHQHLTELGYDFGPAEAEIDLIFSSEDLFEGGVRALKKFGNLEQVFKAVLGPDYLDGVYGEGADLSIPLLLEALLDFGHKPLELPISRRNRYDFIEYADQCQDKATRDKLRAALFDFII
jgi:hypothetical protein